MTEENGKAPVELYRRHRPKTFKDVLGQPEAVESLKQMLRKGSVPHAILLTGSSGTGKTTIARILQSKLGCEEADFHEMNAADTRGIDAIRDIRSTMNQAPLSGGKCRIWLFDECQMFLAPSQSMLLKMLEDTPSHVYFILATTHPQKLLPTIRTRCTEINLKSLDVEAMASLLSGAAVRESFELSPELQDSIIDASQGSARKALVLLHQVMGVEDEPQRIALIQCPEGERQAIEVFRGLMRPKGGWKDMQKVLYSITEEPETVRQMVLSSCNTTMLRGKESEAGRAAAIVDVFAYPFHDSGKAGLTKACWDVIQAGKG